MDVSDDELDVQIEYVPEKISADEPFAAFFGDVFERFSARGGQINEPEVEIVQGKSEQTQDEDSGDEEV